jgi:integrase
MCEVAGGVDGMYPKYKIRKIPNRKRDIPIPTLETVRTLLSYKYVKDWYFNKYIQYLFFFGFIIGLAPEKEFLILNLDDVNIDDFGNNFIRIIRPKVRNTVRKLPLEKTIAISKVHMSVRNYLQYIRPKITESNYKGLFPNPYTGLQWKNEDEIRRFLTKYGKLVYKPFFPYLMRHWCGTARMIEWGSNDRALGMVKYQLGHTKLDQVTNIC